MKAVLELIQFSEGLKRELRHSWLSDGRQESVAEHTWSLCMLMVAMEPHLEKYDFDMCRAMKMIVVHDLTEVIATDIPLFETENNNEQKELKLIKEQEAIKTIAEQFSETVGEDIRELWLEHEAQQTFESKVVRVLDKLDAQIQHNLADLSTWTDWERNRVFSGALEEVSSVCPELSELCAVVLNQAKLKLEA